jgi:hypothetical protein
MVILYVYLRICTKKTRFYRTDAQIKQIKMVCEGKTFPNRPLRICVSVYFLKKSQPNQLRNSSFQEPCVTVTDDRAKKRIRKIFLGPGQTQTPAQKG